MKKCLLMLLAGFMALGASVKANASARLDGMGANVYAVEDLDMVFVYPNTTLEYSNIANIRGLEAANQYGGLILKDDAIGGMGLFTNMPVIGQSDPAATPNRFNLMWGNNFSGTTFGVALNYSATSWDSNNTYNRDMGINVGVGLTADTFSQIDIHASYDTGSAAAAGTSANNAPSIINIGALAQKDLDANNDLRMFANVALGSDAGFLANTSSTNVNVGLAGNRKVNDGKGLVATGLMINYTDVTGSSDDYQLLWFGSVEAKVADWLTLRTGGNATLYDATGYAGFAFKTGASINWQNFILDLDVNPASFENSIAHVEPGEGIFFTNVNGNADNGIVTVTEADLSYKF